MDWTGAYSVSGCSQAQFLKSNFSFPLAFLYRIQAPWSNLYLSAWGCVVAPLKELPLWFTSGTRIWFPRARQNHKRFTGSGDTSFIWWSLLPIDSPSFLNMLPFSRLGTSLLGLCLTIQPQPISPASEVSSLYPTLFPGVWLTMIS